MGGTGEPARGRGGGPASPCRPPVAGRGSSTVRLVPPAASKEKAAELPIRPEARRLLDGIIGKSAAIRTALRQAMRVAPEPVDVLILGPTGAGKEGIARLLHEASGRSGSFVAVNCGCLSRELGASDLFGHVKGAFTGANADRLGLLLEAQGGTLFLDEVGELPPEMQTALLRVVQERVVVPVGTTAPRPLDVRIVAATHRDLGQRVEVGAFREDLFHRLAGFVLNLPALAQRGADVVLIARDLLETDEVCRRGRRRLSRGAALALMAHPWPGNVRELRQVLRRIVLTTNGARIEARHVAAALGSGASAVEGEGAQTEVLIRGVLNPIEALSPAEISARLPVSPKTAQRTLRGLCARGKAKRVGEGRGTRYLGVPVGETAPSSSQDPRTSAVLALARSQGSVTRALVSRRLGLPARSATRLLVTLCEAGLLAAQGASARARTYVAVEVQPRPSA